MLTNIIRNHVSTTLGIYQSERLIFRQFLVNFRVIIFLN